MKKVFCVVEVWVELILASQGEHGVVLTQTMHLAGRVAHPYANVVKANSSCDRMCYMPFALASASNGTDSK